MLAHVMVVEYFLELGKSFPRPLLCTPHPLPTSPQTEIATRYLEHFNLKAEEAKEVGRKLKK